jgi:hypothetical protein
MDGFSSTCHFNIHLNQQIILKSEGIVPSEMSEQTMQTGQCKTPRMTPIGKTKEVIVEQQQKDKKVCNNSRRQTHSFGKITVMFCLPYAHIKQSASQYGHIKLTYLT